MSPLRSTPLCREPAAALPAYDSESKIDACQARLGPRVRRGRGRAASPGGGRGQPVIPLFFFSSVLQKQSPFQLACNAISDREEGRFVLPPSHLHPMPRATASAVVSPFAKVNALKLSLTFHFSLHSFALSWQVMQRSTVLPQRRGARLRPQSC